MTAGTLEVLTKIGRETSIKTLSVLVQVNRLLEDPQTQNRNELDVAVSENRSSLATVIEALKANLQYALAVPPVYADLIGKVQQFIGTF